MEPIRRLFKILFGLCLLPLLIIGLGGYWMNTNDVQFKYQLKQLWYVISGQWEKLE